ncbi:MAG: AsmA family protein [Pseudomonadota bacterium]|nr:AsmA family protein [Pseudomonadota bacterium]
MNTSLSRFSLLQRWLAGIAAFVVILALVVYFFPWDALRGPINRYVSEQLGRRFEITRHLAVKLGRITTVRADGVEIANPDWAHEPLLLKAKAAEFDLHLWPLLRGRVELPRIALTEPHIGLQIEPDGRRTWALSRDATDPDATPHIGALLVDQGSLTYRAKAQGANLNVIFSLIRESAAPLPLSYQATGTWKNESFTASGHAGGVLKLSKDTEAPFPLEISAAAGRTRLKAKGSISDLADMAGINAAFELQGHNLDDLYKLLGVVLPSTPPYKLRARLDKQDRLWAVSQIEGTLGKSDLSGALSFDQSAAVPLLSGKVASRRLDFEDLGPVIGWGPAGASSPQPRASSASGAAPASRPRTRAPGKVLPVTPLNVAKLKAMNADVTYSAADIRHVKALPLDKGSVHVRLKAGVMQLDPISLGVAGGSVAGRISIDANQKPATFTTRLDVRAVQLNQLFPTIETSQRGFGKISGDFDLNGRGNTLAQMLGSASGNMAVLMGKGQISNILLEYMGLDGGEIIKFLVRGDRNVQLRCAAAAFDVKQGLMTSRAIVLDTSDTVITGVGEVNLARETLDIRLKPSPKDPSILSLRSPLRISGTFGAPTAAPENTALAGRVGLAVLLGAINPLLALAATIETGPGEDANCAGILKQAATPKVAPGKQ